jgi:saccharopine dehydrogenase (NADP+, L-glutamate forming)
MSESIPASGTVHWVGAGLSTGSGLRVVCDSADRVVLWARSERKAEDRLAKLGLDGRAQAAAFDFPSLTAVLKPGDVVVSMLPAAEHAGLLRLCIGRSAHFACSSYASEAIAAEAASASQAGIVVLTEAGLDPGIDHLFAHRLVALAGAAAGDSAAVADFTSYCGGIPAVPNAFRYRFSWAPRGVLSALCEPGRYIEEGTEKVAVYPWEATRRRTLGGEKFEAYPNRDSIPFISQYKIPSNWRLETFVRGTLRLDGWSDAWASVFTELRTGDKERMTALANELAARYPTSDTDLDRVVLAVTLQLRPSHGEPWSGEYLIDLTGDQSENAMARCVSLPLSFGITEIIAGRMPPGLHRAAEDSDEAQRWIAFLEGQGIDCKFSLG